MRSAQYYSTQNQVIWPKEFKEIIDSINDDMFASGQHDAEEFLTFILNATHEDLNRVVDKPYVLDEDYYSVDPQEAFLDALAKHKLRNNSIISENFMGMLLCTTNCSVCNKEAVKIEPFTGLQLEIPQDQEGE